MAEDVKASVGNTDHTQAETAEKPAESGNRKDIEEITIKFAKGLCGEPFMSKNGTELVRIQIPNSDPADHRPWQEFVLTNKHVHENQYGKGLWAKIPANGHTTVSRPFLAGKDENGRNIWDAERREVPNRELKEMVEYYKSRGRDAGAPASPDQQTQGEKTCAGTDPQMEKPESDLAGAKAPPGKKTSMRDQLKTGKNEAEKANSTKTKVDKKPNKEPTL